MAVLTSNYPTSLDTTTTLGEVSNRAKTTLAVALANTGETQISLTDASLFPNSGAVTIDNEIFYYSSKSTNVLTIESRARQGTSAAAHSGGALVYLRLTKGHYEVLRTAIINLETKIGVNNVAPTSGELLYSAGGGTDWQTPGAIGLVEYSSIMLLGTGNAQLSLDDSEGISMLGDFQNSSNGLHLKIDDPGRTITMLYGGKMHFYFHGGDKLYKFGDVENSNNGSILAIDDNNLVLDLKTGVIGLHAEGSARTLRLGDSIGNGNGTYIFIDDSNTIITASKDFFVPDISYDGSWDGNFSVPTKSAIFNTFEYARANAHLPAGLSGQTYLSLSGQDFTANAVNLSGTHVTGTLAAARFPALTGNVTTSAGSLATTIAAAVVTFAMMHTGSWSDDTTLALDSSTLFSTQHAIKTYVDTSITGLKFKKDVRVASTANITVSNPGTSTFDSVSISSGDRILLKNQSTATENGVYIFNGSGSALTRATDGDTGAELISATFPVREGTVNQDTWWTITNDTITIGSTNIVFSQTGGAGTYVAGSGLTLTGNSFSISSGGVVNGMLAGSITASKLVGTDIATVGTITTGTWQGTVIGPTYGGTGVNNASRTLTINTNSGTISFTSSVTLTVAATASISGTNTGDRLPTIGDAVTGGGANRILYEDGSSNLAASSNLTYASNLLTLNGDITLTASGTSRVINWGQNTGVVTYYYDDGTSTGKAGIALIPFETQHFNTNVSHFSWNKGGQLNTTGVNELMRLDCGNGWLAIGTTAGSAKLHVISTTEQFRVGYDTSNYYKTTVGSTGTVTLDAVGSGSKFVFSDAIEIAASTSDSSLRIGSTEFQAYAFNNTFWGDNTYFDSGAGTWKYRATGYTVLLQLVNGDFRCFTSPSGSAGGTSVQTERFRIDNTTGNVSIGLASAGSARLHIIHTAEQVRIGYDASNYYKTTVSSTGGVTFDAVGSGALFSFADDILFPNTRTHTMTRTVPTTVNDAVDIGTFTLTNGAGTFDVYITVPSTGFSVAKKYSLVIKYNVTANTWTIVLPIKDTASYISQDIALDAKVNNADLTLRIRRSLGTSAGTAYITIIRQGVESDTFTPSTTVNSVAAPTAWFTEYNTTSIFGGALTTGTASTYALQVGNSAVADLTFGSDGSYAYIQSWASKPLVLNGQGNHIILGTTTNNVGVGTSTISAKLHIISTTEQLRIGYDASNYYKTTVGSTGGVTFDAVGSGAKFTFSDAVDIDGTLNILGTGGTNRTLNFGANFSAGAIWFYDGGATGRLGIGVRSSEFQFFVPSGNHYSWNTGGDLQTSGTNEWMRLDSDGLKIGTTTAGSIFFAQGTGTVFHRTKSTSAGGRVLFQVEADSAYFDMRAHGTTYSETLMSNSMTQATAIFGRNGLFAMGSIENYDVVIGTNNNEVIRIKNSGNVGIGTSSTVSAKLHILYNGGEQARLGYDTSNYYKTTVGSTGIVTFDAVGSGSSFVFSDPVTARINPRVGTTASSSTPTPNADTDDMYTVTALAAGATFGAPSGTPVNGQKLVIRIKDNSTVRSLAWNAIYRAVGVTLPTTTVSGKTLYVGMFYNSADSKWDVTAVGQE